MPTRKNSGHSVATMFNREKTKWLNILHAGWPAGLVAMGVLFIGLDRFFPTAPWAIKVGLIGVRGLPENPDLRDALFEFFGKRKPLRDITAGDAGDFKRWLANDKGDDGPGGAGLGANTVAKRCQFAKQFFANAVRGKVQGSPSRATQEGGPRSR